MSRTSLGDQGVGAITRDRLSQSSKCHAIIVVKRQGDDIVQYSLHAGMWTATDEVVTTGELYDARAANGCLGRALYRLTYSYTALHYTHFTLHTSRFTVIHRRGLILFFRYTPIQFDTMNL